MRFGWLAAAAALVCSVPASAARYYEFQVSGYNNVGFLNPFTNNFDRFLVATTINATFDTIAPTGTYIASSPGVDPVYLQFNFSSRLLDVAQGQGVYFDRMFDRSQIVAGSSLSALNTTGTFGYNVCPSSCADNGPGVLTAVLARTSDIAPALLGVTSRSTFTLLPEPASWAMMIVGIGAVGAAARRKRAAATPVMSN